MIIFVFDILVNFKIMLCLMNQQVDTLKFYYVTLTPCYNFYLTWCVDFNLGEINISDFHLLLLFKYLS